MTLHLPAQLTEYCARWERGERFFLVHLARDLLDDWHLTQTWGQSGTSRGAQVRRRVLRNLDEATRVLNEIHARRAQSGDQLQLEQIESAEP